MSNGKHIPHLEDLLLEPDHVYGALDVLDDIVQEFPNHFLSEKFDGAPAVVFGRSQISGHFFVSTKRFFNKNSIKCFSEDQIDTCFLNEEVRETLKTILHSIGPVFDQDYILFGDVVKLPSSTIQYPYEIRFGPNTMRYCIKKSNDAYENAKNSKVGIALHTSFHGTNLEPKYEHTEFNKLINDVWLFDTRTSLKKNKSREFVFENLRASELGLRASELGHNSINMSLHIKNMKLFKKQMSKYINCKVRNGVDITTLGGIGTDFDFVTFIKNQRVGAGNKFIKDLDELIYDINTINLNAFFDLYARIGKTKNSLVELMEPKYQRNYCRHGNYSEGLVYTKNDKIVKLVNRNSFSKANFDKNGNF